MNAKYLMQRVLNMNYKAMLDKIGKESKFADGLRCTDQEKAGPLPPGHFPGHAAVRGEVRRRLYGLRPVRDV